MSSIFSPYSPEVGGALPPMGPLPLEAPDLPTGGLMVVHPACCHRREMQPMLDLLARDDAVAAAVAAAVHVCRTNRHVPWGLSMACDMFLGQSMHPLRPGSMGRDDFDKGACVARGAAQLSNARFCPVQADLYQGDLHWGPGESLESRQWTPLDRYGWSPGVAR